jgi:phosphoribosylaminoimidazole-succinocarboxamide synthase
MTKLMHGKVKTLYDVPGEAEKVLIKFEDKVTAFDGKMVDYPRDKGATCCLISALLFEKLAGVGIKNHYLELPSLNTMLCKKVTIVPIEVICRNFAAGSIVKNTDGLTEGMPIQPPIVEFFLKNDTKGDPLLTEDRVRLMGHNPEPLREQAVMINDQLQILFNMCGITLVDFKLEFGYDVHGDLYLADELSPDSMRLWGKGTQERFDKDLFRKDEGDIVEAYKYILQNLRQFA